MSSTQEAFIGTEVDPARFFENGEVWAQGWEDDKRFSSEGGYLTIQKPSSRPYKTPITMRTISPATERFSEGFGIRISTEEGRELSPDIAIDTAIDEFRELLKRFGFLELEHAHIVSRISPIRASTGPILMHTDTRTDAERRQKWQITALSACHTISIHGGPQPRSNKTSVADATIFMERFKEIALEREIDLSLYDDLSVGTCDRTAFLNQISQRLGHLPYQEQIAMLEAQQAAFAQMREHDEGAYEFEYRRGVFTKNCLAYLASANPEAFLVCHGKLVHPQKNDAAALEAHLLPNLPDRRIEGEGAIAWMLDRGPAPELDF